jgi:WD40 repeat protein
MAQKTSDMVACSSAMGCIVIPKDPVKVACQLVIMYRALQSVANAADCCEDICKAMIEDACAHAPTLCKLLALGKLYPDDHEERNAALFRCLKSALRHVEQACDAIYEYMQHSIYGRHLRAAEHRSTMQMIRSSINDRFRTFAPLAADLSATQAMWTVAPMVEAAQAVQTNLLALQSLSSSDYPRVHAIANAGVKREQEGGQILDTTRALHLSEYGGVAPSPDGRWLSTWGDGASVWDAATGTFVQHLKSSRCLKTSWSPSGDILASCSGAGTVILWKIDTSNHIHNLPSNTRWMQYASWCPIGKMKLEHTLSQGLIVTEPAEASSGFNYLKQGDNIIKWSPCGNLLASCSNNNTVKVLQASTCTPVHTLQGHTKVVRCVTWSPCGSMLAACSEDCTVRVWDAVTGSPVHSLHGHTKGVKFVEWSPCGGMLASWSHDDTIRVWDVDKGAQLQKIQCVAASGGKLSWNPCGELLAAYAGYETVMVWHAATGSTVRTLRGHTVLITSVTWSPDGSRLASSSHDGIVRVWCVDTGATKLVLQKSVHDPVLSVTWSPCGSMLLLVTMNKVHIHRVGVGR